MHMSLNISLNISVTPSGLYNSTSYRMKRHFLMLFESLITRSTEATCLDSFCLKKKKEGAIELLSMNLPQSRDCTELM